MLALCMTFCCLLPFLESVSYHVWVLVDTETFKLQPLSLKEGKTDVSKDVSYKNFDGIEKGG